MDSDNSGTATPRDRTRVYCGGLIAIPTKTGEVVCTDCFMERSREPVLPRRGGPSDIDIQISWSVPEQCSERRRLARAGGAGEPANQNANTRSEQ